MDTSRQNDKAKIYVINPTESCPNFMETYVMTNDEDIHQAECLTARIRLIESSGDLRTRRWYHSSIRNSGRRNSSRFLRTR